MKKTVSFILSICLLFSMLIFVQIPAMAEKTGSIGNNVLWVIKDDGTLVVSGNGKIDSVIEYGDEDAKSLIKHIVIENGITEIGNNVFAGLRNVVSVTMANSVESIYPYAFSDCQSLKELTLSENLKKLGAAAFMFCSSLESLYIPDGAEYDYLSANMVGTVVLSCTSLKEFKVSPENPNYTVADGVLFSKDKTTLIAYPPGKTDTTYVVPSGVTTVADGAFEECNNLKAIIFSEGVTEIGAVALWKENLETLVFPKSLKYIAPFQYLKDTVKIYYAGSEEDWGKVNEDRSGYSCTPTYYNVTDNTISELSIPAITVKYNDDFIVFDVEPRIINGRTMVPMRAIFEKLGATVEWNGETRTVTSEKNETKIIMTIDSDKMYVNNKSVKLDSPACIVSERTLVPVRAISEAFNLNVEWNGETRTVIITQK